MARPRIIQSPDEAWDLGQEYFRKCESEEKPITITGLSLALGLHGRDSLLDYEKRSEFSDTIKSLKAYVEMKYEERLSGANATGSIFALKNFGWADKQETQHSGVVQFGWLV